jgi:hypothetical protein
MYIWNPDGGLTPSFVVLCTHRLIGDYSLSYPVIQFTLMQRWVNYTQGPLDHTHQSTK